MFTLGAFYLTIVYGIFALAGNLGPFLGVLIFYLAMLLFSALGRIRPICMTLQSSWPRKKYKFGQILLTSARGRVYNHASAAHMSELGS